MDHSKHDLILSNASLKSMFPFNSYVVYVYMGTYFCFVIYYIIIVLNLLCQPFLKKVASMSVIDTVLCPLNAKLKIHVNKLSSYKHTGFSYHLSPIVVYFCLFTNQCVGIKCSLFPL